jgi:hypothetical protein
VALIPEMLRGHPHDPVEFVEMVRKVATASGPLSEEGNRRIVKLENLLSQEGTENSAKRTDKARG